MKEIMAIIRMNMINQTKQALSDEGILSMTAKDCLGRGKGLVDHSLLQGAEAGYEEAISQLGQSGRLIPKRLLLVVVPDTLVPITVKTIIKVNQSGDSVLDGS
jgi:nitrogen regulatory protein PII 2